jgi:predicted amidohydrolase
MKITRAIRLMDHAKQRGVRVVLVTVPEFATSPYAVILAANGSGFTHGYVFRGLDSIRG